LPVAFIRLVQVLELGFDGLLFLEDGSNLKVRQVVFSLLQFVGNLIQLLAEFHEPAFNLGTIFFLFFH